MAGPRDAAAPPAPPLPDVVLADEPYVSVARIALGLTIYIDDPLRWAHEGARAVLAAFLERVPARDLRLFITSVQPEFRMVTGGEMAKLMHDMVLPAHRTDVRHLLWLRIVDDPGAPELAFSYREIDSTRQGRCGFVEMTFPLGYDPESLAALAAQIGEQWPHLCGIGGYVASINGRELATGLDAAYPWTRRLLGLDIQDPETMAWHVPRGLPGSSWLTMIGRQHAEALEIDLDALAKRAWRGEVKVRPLARGVLVRAGEAPSLGDLNRLTYPWEYAEVARALSPHFVAEPPPFLGPRWREEPDRTARWMRRLVDPEGWR
jgi:hypothetical protein